MNTLQATNTPVMLRLAGGVYPVRALTYREMAELSSWLDANVQSPLGRAIREIAHIRANGGVVDQATEDAILDRAEDRMMSWPPRPATRDWFRCLNKAQGGMVELVRSILSRTVPGFDHARAEVLFDAMSAEEFETFYHRGIFGKHPKSGGDVPEPERPMEVARSASGTPQRSTIGVQLPTDSSPTSVSVPANSAS